MAAGRNWSQEEVEEILRRAIERQQKTEAAREGTSHEDLLAAAREVGIDPSSVEAAAADLAKETAPADAPKALAKRGEKWPRFLRALVSFAAPTGFLLLLHQLTGDFGWARWVAFGLGLGFVLKSIKIFFPTDEDAAEDVRGAMRKAAREERRARRRAQKEARRQTEREFEEAVEAGVHALLGIAAKKIRENLEPKPKVRVQVDDPKRVEVHEPEAVELEAEDQRRRGR